MSATRDDLLDQVPADIGITRIGDEWYLTTRHGSTFEEHQHIEIKLDRERLLQLYSEVTDAVAEITGSVKASQLYSGVTEAAAKIQSSGGLCWSCSSDAGSSTAAATPS
jgi:hypothetical protein